MSTKNKPTPEADVFNNGVLEYVKQNMANSQVTLNDSGVPFLEELATAIKSRELQLSIKYTTHGLPPMAAERKYKSEDGLRIKVVGDGSFILLTPLLYFVIIRVNDDVCALTYPIIQKLPDDKDILIMASTIVDMGTLILNQLK